MTTKWITQPPSQYSPVDLDVLQEAALSMAQSTIQNAMDQTGLKPGQLAKRMGRHKSFVSRMLGGRHNLTVKTFALALGACGLRPQFGYAPLMWQWAADPPAPTERKGVAVPTGVGTSILATDAGIGVLIPGTWR